VAVAVAVRKGAPKPDISTLAVRKMPARREERCFIPTARAASAGASFDQTLKTLASSSRCKRDHRAQAGAGEMEMLAKAKSRSASRS